MPVEPLIQLLQKSIQIPSITGKEKLLIDFLVNEMIKLGFDDAWVDSAGNAIGEIVGNHPGKTMLLDAHADTVGVHAEDWKFDPFGGTIHQDRIFGRGSADTKGNLVAMIDAAARVDRNKIFGKIYVSATVHEEVYEGGSLKVVIDQVKPDYVVIGEATNLNINHGGRGRAEIVVETIGQSAHSSSPEVGKCAVHEMIRLIQFIEKQEMKHHPQLGPATMVLTDMMSMPYPGYSVVPNRCRVTFDRRLLIGETIASLENELLTFASQANIDCNITLLEANETTYTNFNFQGKKFFPAWLFSENHEFVRKTWAAVKNIIPGCALSTFRFCTNGAYSAGVAGIPTIGFGLGKETDAHTVDESISIQQLLLASDGYKALIEEVLQ